MRATSLKVRALRARAADAARRAAGASDSAADAAAADVEPGGDATTEAAAQAKLDRAVARRRELDRVATTAKLEVLKHRLHEVGNAVAQATAKATAVADETEETTAGIRAGLGLSAAPARGGATVI